MYTDNVMYNTTFWLRLLFLPTQKEPEALDLVRAVRDRLLLLRQGRVAELLEGGIPQFCTRPFK